ncbi:MAG: hypothetical protein IRZ32_13445, partial [Solirubrobacteraceae bacterium]|nr:hypothetical protein [Solirubrobacteraceae bacterium]
MSEAAASPTPRPVRAGAVLMTIAQVVTALGGFLTTIVVARILGADGLGAYTVALSLLLILGAIGSLGLENGIAWSVAGRRWSPRSALRESQALALGLGLACMALVLAARLAFPSAFAGMSVGVTLIAAAGLPFFISWQYARFLAVARDRYEAFVVPPALVTVLALVLCAAGAAVDDVRGMVAGLTVAYVLTAVVALAAALRSRLPAAGPAGRGPLREAVGFG